MRRHVFAGGAAALVVATAAVAAPYLVGLEPGQYEVTPLGAPAATGSICLGDLAALYRAAHGPDRCQYYVANRDDTHARVSYECAGGSGLLTVTTLTPRTATVKASGIAGSTPYKRNLTLRRTGACR